VAPWAGHSVAVLHEVYAKVLAGLEEESLGKIARILGLPADEDDEGEAGNGQLRPIRALQPGTTSRPLTRLR
jgi:hypothetical protein